MYKDARLGSIYTGGRGRVEMEAVEGKQGRWRIRDRERNQMPRNNEKMVVLKRRNVVIL